MNKNTEKTEFEPSFVELEKQTDATKKVVEKLLNVTPTYLQPNPASRTKFLLEGKFKKNPAERRYPHAELEVVEAMSKGGEELGSDSLFGQALMDAGEAFKTVADQRHALDTEVHQSFLEPLKNLMEHDIKEIMKHRKKLEGRRLDYDYKRRKQTGGKSSVSDADIKIAESKLDESKSLSEAAMINLLESDVDQVGQLQAFIQAHIQFYQQCAETLSSVSERLAEKQAEAKSRAPRERKAVPLAKYDDDDEETSHGGSQPCCKATFDFEAENEGELSFKEGDMIKLVSRLDDNWLEGEVRGKTGIFPTNYVEIITDVS
jgi:endophilin-A